MTVLTAYLASPMPRRSRPSLDRLIAVLDGHPAGLTRKELGSVLHLTYVGVVDVLGRAERLGWVRGHLEPRPGQRSVLVYRACVPEGVNEGGVEVSPGGGRGGGVPLSSRARAPGQKISGPDPDGDG